ncbi:MAG: ParB N-terminal domain-containing protein [Planctomycetota bacterium]
MSNKLQIPINEIIMGERHRQDMGDLAALAASIRELGLLQPIGVTEENQLVFGERRLKACRDILNWKDIPARIIRIDRIVDGEHAKNEIRKDFTVSERVAQEQLARRLGVSTAYVSRKLAPYKTSSAPLP